MEMIKLKNERGIGMKKLLVLLLTCCVMLSLVACGSESASTAAEDEVVKIGLVLSTGGLGDKNFNDMTYEGMLRAQEDYGIEFDYLEPESVSDFVSNLRLYAESGDYDLVMGIGSSMSDAMLEVATDFPDQCFSIIDAEIEGDNISSVATPWQEQTFMTGVLAGLGTLSEMEKANGGNVIGVILGESSPLLERGVTGFMAGAMYVNPDVEVLEVTIGDFNDPSKGKEVALSMYAKGADFIQHIAGASGLGTFTAATEADKYVFGVGGNQNENEPDYIVATALRDVDQMVYNEVEGFATGNWAAGVYISGLAEGAVGFETAGSNVEIPADIQVILEEVEGQVVAGDLVPVSEREELETWVAANQYFS